MKKLTAKAKTLKSLIRKIERYRKKAFAVLQERPSGAQWDLGYSKGFDVALRNAMQIIREVK